VILPGLIDQLDFANTDLLVDARAVLRGGLRGSHWATNGSALLMLLQRTCHWQALKRSAQTGHKSTAIGAVRPARVSRRAVEASCRRRASRPPRLRVRTCTARIDAPAPPSCGRRYRRARTRC